MAFKKISKTLIYVLVLICLNLNNAYATTTDTSSTIDNTEISSATIDVSVPLTSSFRFNPNTGNIESQKITITNNSNVDVSLNIKNISISSNSLWQPDLIPYNSYEDIGWNNLDKAQSKKEIALGISAINNDNWVGLISNKNIWSTETNSKFRIGLMHSYSSVELEPIIKCGTAITVKKELITNYIFEFNLN